MPRPSCAALVARATWFADAPPLPATRPARPDPLGPFRRKDDRDDRGGPYPVVPPAPKTPPTYH